MFIRSRRPSLLAVALASVAAVAGCDTPASKTETTSATTPPAPPPALAPKVAEEGTHAEATTPTDFASRLDPDMKQVIDQLVALNGKPIETLSAADARKQPTPADAVKALLDKEGKSTKPEEVGKVDDRSIATPGGKLPIRVYTPKGKGPFPVIVYYHGGGWVIATNDTYDASARALTNGVNAVVVAVEYRKSPENKFPAAHDDALAAYEWVLKNTASINGDPKKIAVAGESAGGNLAANVAIGARDKGEPLPVHELLVYPVASGDLNTPSEIENANAKPLNRPMMGWFTQQYFRTPADGTDTRINLVAANLKGLPPTTIINAQLDPLRSDGETLAAKLRAAGVPVEQRTFSGVTHEFFGMGAAVQKAKDAETLAIARLKGAFGS
jgi:acetyl esterase